MAAGRAPSESVVGRFGSVVPNASAKIRISARNAKFIWHYERGKVNWQMQNYIKNLLTSAMGVESVSLIAVLIHLGRSCRNVLLFHPAPDEIHCL